MKRMNKLILITVGAVLSASLCACANTKNEPDNSDVETSVSHVQVSPVIPQIPIVQEAELSQEESDIAVLPNQAEESSLAQDNLVDGDQSSSESSQAYIFEHVGRAEGYSEQDNLSVDAPPETIPNVDGILIPSDIPEGLSGQDAQSALNKYLRDRYIEKIEECVIEPVKTITTADGGEETLYLVWHYKFKDRGNAQELWLCNSSVSPVFYVTSMDPFPNR